MESRPVDGMGGGKSAKRSFYCHNGVILVRRIISVGLGLGYISLGYIYV